MKVETRKMFRTVYRTGYRKSGEHVRDEERHETVEVQVMWPGDAEPPVAAGFTPTRWVMMPKEEATDAADA